LWRLRHSSCGEALKSHMATGFKNGPLLTLRP
jgi:hypothetical protein